MSETLSGARGRFGVEIRRSDLQDASTVRAKDSTTENALKIQQATIVCITFMKLLRWTLSGEACEVWSKAESKRRGSPLEDVRVSEVRFCHLSNLTLRLSDKPDENCIGEPDSHRRKSSRRRNDNFKMGSKRCFKHFTLYQMVQLTYGTLPIGTFS